SLRFFDCEMLGITMPVTMRFGLCGANEISDPLRLVNSASFAMEKITDYSRNSFIWYNDTMRDEITLEATITSQMRSAMLENEFVMYVQPQYSHSSGKLVGAEALCRWIRPDGSTVTPQIFIPIFEKNGFVRVLDRYMWDCAFSQVKKWLDAGIEPVPLSVNISRMSLIDDEIITEIGKLSKKYGIDHSYIHFEITESAYIADYANLIERIGKIRDMGFKIAMDDFGSGYSSLNTLKDIPFDILKLDMGFLRGNSSSSKSGIILGSIIRMAHSIELITIAEGVETVIQADFLRSLGCDIIQGYLFARPMPVEDFESLMKKENSSGNVAPETEKKDGNETVTGIFVRNNAIISLFENYVGPAAVLEFSGTYFGLVRVNNDMIRLLGFTNFTAMEFSRSFSAGIAQEDRIKLKDALTKALDGEKGAVCIFGYTRPDGTHICLKAKLWYLGLNGQIPVIYTIVDDVSDVVKDVTGKQE
ncbi:MAG: EAL domain-containing protein, partial [Ruminiclostridium sp.]|nr:EAL domain-containing protein [Ruminiclostridium sp.]